MKNLLWPISTGLFSAGLLIAVSSCFAGDDAAEQQFKTAKAAYGNNNCNDAVAGFRNYLKVDEPGAERKKSILAAMAWCEKQNRKQERYARMSMTAVGSTAPSAAIKPVPMPMSMDPPVAAMPEADGEDKPLLP
jgi:hypothetical protein